MRLTPLAAAIAFLQADQKARDLHTPNAASLSSLRLEDGNMHTREQLAAVLIQEQVRMEQLTQELGDVHEDRRALSDRLSLADQQYAGVVFALAEMTQQRDKLQRRVKDLGGTLDMIEAGLQLTKAIRMVSL